MNIAKSTSTARAVIAEVLAVRGPSKYGGRRSITHALSSNQHIFSTTQRASSTSAQSLPRVAQPSLWQSIIPKFLRRREPGSALVFAKGPRSKEWNPATFYIIIFLLIGSQAIQIIALRNEVTAYTRKADAKIRLLKEVIERVHQGEDVDVRGLLGTGDRSKEKEWEDGKRSLSDRKSWIIGSSSDISTPRD